MSKECTIRSFQNTYPGELVEEQHLSDECMRCIGRVLADGSGEIITRDTRAEGLTELNAAHPGLDPDDAEKWEVTSMRMPDDSASRTAVVENGFDVHTYSYEFGKTSERTVRFDCYNEPAPLNVG